MKKFIAGLCAAVLSAALLAAPARASSLAPVAGTFSGTSGSASVTLVPDINSCSLTISSGATFSGGTIAATVVGSDGTTNSTVSGVPDAGNPTSPVSVISSAGLWTFPVTNMNGFKITLSGATSASIPYSIKCSSNPIQIHPNPPAAATNSGDGAVTVHNVRPTLYTWYTSPSVITTAATSQAIAGVAGETIEIVEAYAIAGGTESAETDNLAFGNCASSPTPLWLLPFSGGATAGQYTTLWSGATGINGNAAGSIPPAAEPQTVPVGQNVCVVTAGTTISAKFGIYYYYDTP